MSTIALCFLAGCLLVQQFASLPELFWLMVAAIMASIMAALRYWHGVFFLLGLLWTVSVADARLADRLPAALAGTDLTITGMITSLPEYDEQRVSFDFAPSSANLPDKLHLTWYQPEQIIKAGQQWQFTVKLKPPHGLLNPNGFDYERLLLMQDIGATGYIRSAVKPVLLADGSWLHIHVWRQYITDRLSETLSHSPSLGLIKALTIGDDNLLTPEQWELFRKTGTTHLVVISGSHIGLIAGLVYFLALRLWAWTGILRWSPPKVAAIVALIVGVGYSALAGFSVPTQRAMIMLSVAMLAIISQRNPRPLHTLATALLAVLIVDPLSVLAAGFWLSFITVGLIIYTVSGRLGKQSVIHEILKLNVLMSLGLIPLTLLFFQQASLVAPIANVVAVPVISFLIVPLALLAVLLMFVMPSLASLLFALVNMLLQLILQLLNYLAALPFATFNHAQPTTLSLLFASLGILLLLAPKGLPARHLGLLLFLPMLFNKPNTSELKLTLLDVGQGLAVVIQTAKHSLVYDTGARFSANSDSGKNVVLPFLWQQGIKQLDLLMISHGDNDHIGGAASVIQGITVNKLLTSVPQQLNDYAAEPCHAGQTWTWDEIKFTVLSPTNGLADSDNNHSCVLQLQTAHGNILLTGDIEAETEAWLVQQYGTQLKSNILIAPHHGSRTSSTLDFLQAVQPKTILIPAGYRNRFGHPHPDVLARYQALSSHWLNNAEQGAITVNLNNGVWQIDSTRQIAARYWNIAAPRPR